MSWKIKLLFIGMLMLVSSCLMNSGQGDFQQSAEDSTEDDARTIGGLDPKCLDGIDNDGDGLTDGDDLGCTSIYDNSEGGKVSGSIENSWTIFEPSADTRMIYVSSTLGNNAFDGLYPTPQGQNRGPKRDLSAGVALMRPGFPDWLRLKRGDTFQVNGYNLPSGRSATEKAVIAPYGPGQDFPKFVSGGSTFSLTHFNQQSLRFFAINGIDFGSMSIQSLYNINDILIEGLKFTNPITAIDIQRTYGAATLAFNVNVRNNLVVRSQSNGFFFKNIQNLLIEGNIIHRPAQDAPWTGNHGMYITREGNTLVKTFRNLVFMGKVNGNAIMQRPGGESYRNIVARHGWSGITAGACNDGGPTCIGGQPTFLAHQNLVLAPFLNTLNLPNYIGCGIGLDLGPPNNPIPYIISSQIYNNIAADYNHDNCARDPFGYISSSSYQFDNNTTLPDADPTLDYLSQHISIGENLDEATFWVKVIAGHNFRGEPSDFTADKIISYLTF
jgi:hypothetical protein